MKSPENTLATLFELQAHAEDCAAKLLRDAQGVKTILKTNPLAAELPELLRELRRDADACKTAAQRLNSALVEHADAEHEQEMSARPKWRASKHASPGQRVRRSMLKRGCLVGDIDAPGFGL
ncbi:hypothetical protein D9M70_425550 [compost metagenome]